MSTTSPLALALACAASTCLEEVPVVDGAWRWVSYVHGGRPRRAFLGPRMLAMLVDVARCPGQSGAALARRHGPRGSHFYGDGVLRRLRDRDWVRDASLDPWRGAWVLSEEGAAVLRAIHLDQVED